MRNEPVCRWLRRQSGGRARYVHLGKPFAPVARFDLVITVPEYPVPDAPNVLRNSFSLHRVTEAGLTDAARTWAPRLADLPRPYIAVLVGGWDLLSRSLGREVTPGFMGEVLKSAQADGALWLLVVAFCIAAPVSEEILARGFLYRGWSESRLGIVGAIILSSLAWTSLHLQYDWFFFGEIFSIGLLLGYLRYRSNSTWLTIVLHGLNNFAATVQTFWLAGSS